MVDSKRKKKGKKCFVVSPIGKKKTVVRKRANAVLKEIITPALNMARIAYKVKRIDRIGGAGDITEGIIDLLRTADLVVADLTDLNPNVMYEMGIRQAWHLPLIPIIDAAQFDCLPFDVQVLSTVPYSIETEKGKKEAIVGIRKQLRSILCQEQKDTVFANAMSLVSKDFFMNSVYSSFLDALTDADHAIFDFKRELPCTLKLQDKKTTEGLTKSLRIVVNRLSDKLYVFQQIARGRPGDYTDDHLLSLISDASIIITKTDNIDSLVMSKKPTSDKIVEASRLLDTMINVIDKVAKKIKTKLN